jgi:hypothetical protein
VTWLACAVVGLAEGEAAGIDDEVAVVVEAVGVETASCAVMILVIKRIAPNAIGNFFMKVVYRSSFQSCDWFVAFAIRAKPVQKLRICTNANRNSGEVAYDLLRAKTRLNLR